MNARAPLQPVAISPVEEIVAEIRAGLPQGAEVLAKAIQVDPTVKTDPKAASDALELARRKVQDLRIAKSTFFALADVGPVGADDAKRIAWLERKDKKKLQLMIADIAVQ